MHVSDYAAQQRNPGKHLVGIGLVMLLHVVLIYGLMNGLARRVVEVVKGPIETKIIKEIKPPPPDAPPPPPPKMAPPPPPFIPPPEVNIAVEQAPVQNTISVVTTTRPAVVQPKAVVRAPVVKASRCREPEYPAASARLRETGRVELVLLVDVDGKVTDSKVEKSSGFPRLDDAARAALSLCRFTPGSSDGKPVQAWARLAYEFKDPNR